MAHETESAAGHELTFDGELLLWLGDESPGVRAADAKRTARLNLISHLLSLIPYEHPDKAKKVKLPPRQRRKYKRPPKQSEREVPVRYTVG